MIFFPEYEFTIFQNKNKNVYKLNYIHKSKICMKKKVDIEITRRIIRNLSKSNYLLSPNN